MATREDPLKGGRNRSPAEIRRDIDRDRDELDVTVGALQSRLAPGALAEEAWNRVRRTVGGTGSGLGSAAKNHPVPLALIGAGLGWLVVEGASGRAVSVGNGGNPGHGDGGALLGRLPGRAGELGERSSESLGRTRLRLRRNLRSNPLSSGVAALGLGVLTGLALPRSRWEDETMGEARDRTVDEARSATRGAVERGTEATREAAQSARETMDEAARRGEPPSERLKSGAHEGAESARRGGPPS